MLTVPHRVGRRRFTIGVGGGWRRSLCGLQIIQGGINLGKLNLRHDVDLRKNEQRSLSAISGSSEMHDWMSQTLCKQHDGAKVSLQFGKTPLKMLDSPVRDSK